MSTMKAFVLQNTDTPPALCDHPLPEPQPGEVRVRLLAAALNRRDCWILQGKYPGITPPVVLGSDGVGIVEAVNGAPEQWIGQRVLLCPSLDWGDNPRFQGPDYTILGNPRDGTFAEAITLPADNIVSCPEHLTDAEAAALPLAGLTAWRALVSRGGLIEGERVLVTGIGGGVSCAGLQLALGLGAEVWVSSSSDEKLATARAMGASGTLRYDQEGWRECAMHATDGFDLILDGAGGPGVGELVRMLRFGGRFVFYGGTRGKWPQILPQHIFYRQVSLLASTMGSPDEFRRMVDFVATQQIRPQVDRVFPLTETADALAHLSSGAQLGKVVIDISQE
jgi:zinc-binding alcohol dehydrogenase/oxidoreductase